MRVLSVSIVVVLLAAASAFAGPDYIGKVTVTAGDRYDCPAVAMYDISAWCVNPSADSRCLMSIGPGSYDVTHAGGLIMQPFVDIEGSGPERTVIRGKIDGFGNAVVLGASDATLSSLTVQNTGGGEFSVAIYNLNASPSIVDVHARASGSKANTAVYNNDSSPLMDNVDALATGGIASYGMRNINASYPVVKGGSARAAGAERNFGIFNIGTARARMEDYVVEGSSAQVVSASGAAPPMYHTLDFELATGDKITPAVLAAPTE